MNSSSEFLKASCIAHLKESYQKIHTSIDRLTEDETWWRPNGESNSMGNIILHLCGNITQYILSSLGGAEDHRIRSSEFADQGPISKQKLLQNLEEIIQSACDIIGSLSESDLIKSRSIQCYEKTGVDIIIHVTEHLSYHTGQIVYFTKWQRAESMGFYDDKALEKKSI